MHRLFRHKLLVGAVALLVAGSAGGAYAATQTGGNSRQAFVNDVAKRLNVTPSQLRAAVRGAMLDRLNAAVKAGELTQAEANRLRQRIEQGGPLALGPLPPGVWHRGLLPGGPPGALIRHSLLGTASSYLGLSPAQLFGDLRGGKTIAQIVQAQNKSLSGLEQALISAAKARLDKLVSAGPLTKAREQRLLNRLKARIDRMVNRPLRLIPRREFVPPGPGPALAAPGGPPPPGA